MVNAAAECHPPNRKAGSQKRYGCSRPLYSLDMAPGNFWLFPKAKMTTNVFNQLKKLKAARTAQLEIIPEEDWRTASKVARTK